MVYSLRANGLEFLISYNLFHAILLREASVSPILVRPVREQLEHDRVIRLLQVRLKKRVEVAANIGPDQIVPVKIGQVQIYPDLVLTTADKSRKLVGTVEVETAESVNHLEAMSQWAHLGRAKAPFHLYVPAGSVDSARRLAAENGVNVSELWSFHTIGDQTRFTLVHRTSPAGGKKGAASGPSSAERGSSVKTRPAAARKTAKPPVRALRPAARKAAKTPKGK
jgi:hypothetical protein